MTRRPQNGGYTERISLPPRNGVGSPASVNGSGSAASCDIQVDDFVAYMPQHKFIFIPTREMWPAASVNARVSRISGIPASVWLKRHNTVEQMTWAPGLPMLIENKLVCDGGWIDRPGCTTFNLYRPPSIVPKLGSAEPWLSHVHTMYPSEANRILKWLAHRVQKPPEKINHALVLGGAQGIGKDTILEPVKRAVGPWNFAEVSPQQALGRFNGFLKSVILRISEARDLGELDRFAFYDHMKAYTAAPPDVLRVDEKHLREHSVLNVCGVILTSNHKAGGIYLPPDDRRHFVAWCTLTKEQFPEDYFNKLYNWYDSGGAEHVAHYLMTIDLSDFDPKAPPPKTQAFFEIVDASRAPEDAELADALDVLGWPDTITLERVSTHASTGFSDWLRDRRNSRQIPHRMEACHYVPVRNPSADDGLWKIHGKRQAVYAKACLTLHDQLASVSRLIERG